MEKLLPVGSVVTLNEAEKKIMIIGVKVQNEENDGTVYDYLGVPYPEGFLSSEMMFVFNHADIQTIHFVGYINTEMQVLRAKMTEMTM